MNLNYETRRVFLKKITTVSVAFSIIPSMFSASNETTFKKNKKEKGLVFLFQGDSITSGNRGRNGDPNLIMGHGYAFTIASQLGCDFPDKNLTFINRGVSGNTVTDLEKRWKEDTLDHKPDVLSILVGINDSSSALKAHPSSNAVTTQIYNDVYRSLLDQVIKQNPNIILVLNQPFAFQHNLASRDWEARFQDLSKRQQIVENIALDYKAVLVRLQDVFNAACSKAPAEYWIWDGIHPTVAGHELIAREWIGQVMKRLSFI